MSEVAVISMCCTWPVTNHDPEADHIDGPWSWPCIVGEVESARRRGLGAHTWQEFTGLMEYPEVALP